MKMSMHENQLIDWRTFVRYCTRDFLGGAKIDVDENWIKLAVEQGYIEPLVRGDDEGGLDKFSPFQIALVAGLEGNYIKNGILIGNSYIFNVGERKQQQEVLWRSLGSHESVKDVINGFSLFLKLLHSLPLLPDDHSQETYERSRMFREAPSINFDISKLTGDAKEIEEQGLSLELLENIYLWVGRLGYDVDPLRRWYYYINRHSRVRKDELGGVAALAQDLYIIADLLKRVMYKVYGSSRVQGLLEEVNDPISAVTNMLPRAEYALGTDNRVLLSVIERTRSWLAKEENEYLSDDRFVKQLRQVELELVEYVNKYGDQFYQSGLRLSTDNVPVSIPSLDTKTSALLKQYVDQMGEDDVKDQSSMQDAINYAVEWRLDNLSRSLWSTLEIVYEKLSMENDRAWDLANNRRGEILSSEDNKRYWDDAMKVKDRKDRFWGIINLSKRIYCASCRENFVQLHTQNNDSVATHDHICDKCITNSRITRNKGVGEWCCSNCGALLLKFVNQNVMSEQLRSGQLLDLKLNYGRLTMTTICKAKECQTENQINIDWGWSP